MRGGDRALRPADLEAEIVVAMRNRLEVSPWIVWLDPNSLERSAHKTRFLEVAGG